MTDPTTHDFTQTNPGADLAEQLTLEAEKQAKEPGFLTIQYLDGESRSSTVTPQ